MKVIDVYYDCDHIHGCPTCDYGSKYISNFTITYEDEHSTTYRIEGDNGKLISEGQLMVILANAISEEEITKEIIKTCKTVLDLDTINYYSGSLYINDKEVNLNE